MHFSGGANAGAARYLSVCGVVGVSCLASNDLAAAGRVHAKFAKTFMVDAGSPLDVSMQQAGAADDDCVLRLAGPGVCADNNRSVYVGVYPACRGIFDLPVWVAVDAARSTATLPSVPWKAFASCESRSPSRTFLAWNGTELICVGGHGLLHVPEMPTSWFSTQRWLYLDPSWEVLFAESAIVPSGYF